MKYVIKRQEQHGSAEYNQRYYRHTIGRTDHWTYLVWQAAQFDTPDDARQAPGYATMCEIVPVEKVRGETREVAVVK